MKKKEKLYSITLASIAIIFMLIGIAGAAPFAYITNSGSSNISVFDTATDTYLKNIVVGNSPIGVAVNPAGTRAYVANEADGTISVIDTTTNTVIETVSGVSSPFGVAVNPAGTEVYVTTDGGTNVTIINTTTTPNTVKAIVPVGSLPTGIAVNPAGTKVYVADYDDHPGTVSVIDTTSNSVDTLYGFDGPKGVAVNSAGTRAYVANNANGTVSVIDITTTPNTVIETVAVGGGPEGVAVNPAGTKVYVTQPTQGTVSIIDTTNSTATEIVSGLNGPSGVSVNPDGTKVYVVNSNDNPGTVSVISTATNTVVNTLTVGDTPIVFGQFIGGIEPVPPVANFSSNVTSGDTPLSVQFNDSSEHATAWNWDFGDGNNSTEQNPMHTFSAEGNYTVNLTASNVNGTDSYLATINVSAQSDVQVGRYAYITNSGSHNVSVIDTETNTVIATIPVGNTPWGVAVNPDGSYAYVTNSADDNVSVIDIATNTVTTTVNVGDSPWAIAVNPDETKVYVTNYLSNNVTVIDTTNNTVTATVDVGNNPFGVAINPEGTTVYVVNTGDGIVSVIDTANNTITANVSVGESPYGIAISPDGTEAYIVNMGSGNVSIIDTSSNTITGSVTVGSNPQGVAVSPDGTKAYVTNADDNNVSVIDTTNNTVTGSVTVGNFPYGVSVSHDGTKVFVANGGGNTVSVIDTANNTVTATVTVGNNPYAFGLFIGGVQTAQLVLPIANFSSNITEGYAPLDVQFNDSSENADELYWDFGDGTNSTEQNPIHIFSEAGNYTVNLTASNENGTDSYLATINVSEQPVLPEANFSTNVTEGYAPLDVQFTDLSENATEWNWDFGNGDNSTEQNPIHTFSEVGNYTVNLTASNGNGSDSYLATINVSEQPILPEANFSTNVISGYAPLSVQFSDSSLNATEWNWDFGDGNTSTEQNPMHDFYATGNHVVNLTVSNENGTNSAFIDITVLEQPVEHKSIAYVPSSVDNLVSVIDTSDNSIKANVPVGTLPYGVAVTLDGKKIYVPNYADNTVSVIDAATNNVTAIVPVGSNPFGAAATPNGTKVYVANQFSNSTSVIDTVNNTVVATIDVGGIPAGIAVNPTGTKVYVTVQVSSAEINNVSVIDTASDTVTANVSLGNTATGIAVSPTGRRVYVTQNDGNVIVIDTASNTVKAIVGVGSNPNGIAVNPTGTRVYVANGGNNNVSVIDTASNTVTASVPVGSNPFGVAVTLNGTKVYVANQGSNDVSEIDTTTNTVTATVPVGRSPFAIGQFIGPELVLPVANFSTNVTSGYTPLSVQFTDNSENATELGWDFNNDALPDSFDPNPTYVFGAGNHTVTLTVSNENGTDSESITINVSQTTPTITWSNPADITFGTALDGTQLNASASVPGNLTYNPEAGTILGAGNDQQLNVELTPDDSVNYTNASANVSINVTKVTPTIIWSNPADITFGTELDGTQLNASASVPGNLTYTPAEGTVLGAGNDQQLNVDFTPTDAANYTNASENVTINVLQAVPEITWSNPQDIVFGTALNETQLNASASVNGTLVYTPINGTILAAGQHILHVDLTPEDVTNYTNASANVSINITKVATEITWSNPADIVYGTPLSSTQLNASASVPGNFTYNPAEETVLGVGNHTLQADFTPTDATNYTGASENVTINVLQAVPEITWNNPQDIVYGTVLNGTQLNAVASTNGTLIYTPANGTVLGVGQHTLQADLTPTDAANYTNASKNVSINVTSATPTITWSNPADIVYGTALNGTQLNASASVPGNFTYDPATGTILDAGQHTLHVYLTPTEAANYTNASKNVTINVSAQPVLPVANFSTNVTEGYAPLSVQFNDSSENATAWNWDFGDGNNSTDRNPVHIYATSGNYTVNLTASNANGTNSTSANITVLEESGLGANLYLSENALESKHPGSSMNYTLYYQNFGDRTAQNVVLEDVLSSDVEFESASDGGIYNNSTRKVTWDIGPVAPAEHGYRTITVEIPLNVSNGTVIYNNASINTSDPETGYEDNEISIQTLVVSPNLPENVSVEPTNGDAGIPSVYWGEPITFSYHSCDSATGVNISIHIDDGQPDINGTMTGGPADWNYTTTFYPRNGKATVNYTVYGCDQSTESFSIYVDPAGYIYDMETGNRIAGASVWLQRPDGEGDWENVPTGQNPAISQPDTNPLITDDNGMYQWDVLNGTYRVHVEATGYEPKNSYAVMVPPAVTDLHVGLVRIPDANYSIFKSVINPDPTGDCIINLPGDEIPYRIVVKNEGEVNLTNVVVDDPMLSLPEPTGDDTDPGVLNTGETWIYDVIYTLTPEDAENGSINNNATVVCSELPEKTSSVNTPVDQNADLSIYKSVTGIDEAGDHMINSPGDVINYRVAVKNNGDVDLTGVLVSDPMVNLTKTTGDGADPGVFNPGETWVYAGDYTVTQEDIDTNGNSTGLITNTATVSCNELSSESSTLELQIIRIINTGTDSENNNTPAKVYPKADFSTSLTSGYVPLTVQFTDRSTGSPTSWSWDFNNDGVADSNEMSPVYTYNTPGTYVAKLTVSNANGSNSTTATITVLQTSSSNDRGSSEGSSSGSSHSSGGGTSGSAEPASNVEAKEISQAFIGSGNTVRFDFPKNATPVTYLSFDSKKTFGKTTTIVEMLKGKSTFVSALPSDEVYKFVNIWIGNSGVVTNNIENAVVYFKVEKSWIQDKKIDQSSITLNRYSDNKWEQLQTSQSNEDDNYLYFTAKTPGFSPFAITGKTTVTGAEVQPGTSTQGSEQNNGNTAANTEQTPGQKNNTSTPAKQSKKTPGYEIICGITGLLAVYLYRRR